MLKFLVLLILREKKIYLKHYDFNMIPTEDIEAQKLATRLRFKNYTFTHFANES